MTDEDPGRYRPNRHNNNEVLSIAEEILREKSGIRPPSERRPTLDFSTLQEMDIEQLGQIAQLEGIVQWAQLSRSELIFQVLRARMLSSGIMLGEGTLEILSDGFGFLRSAAHHYVACPDDIYVSPSQIRRFGLTTGMTISGQIRPPKENERYFALLRVEAINHRNPNEVRSRKSFDLLTALHPTQRIIMETDPSELATRVIDLVTPLGFGQRGLIVSPPRAGKTILMQKMARAVLANYPDVYVMMLLIDERPEEVTDMQREVRGPKCEIISSTFDEPASRHIQVTQMVLEKAKRMVEDGVDVIVFLDSITRLARAWNGECIQSGKTLTGGLDANAMQKPKAFFGAARKVEEGGSLTIIATALVGTGSRMDEVIFEEFKGTGNMEIVLDRALVDRRIWPAVDIYQSGTRREEALLDPIEYQKIVLMRKALAGLSASDAMEQLVDRLQKTRTNPEFLLGLKA
ncbi:MAG: transcription termination factor Rho [Planctomycetota bacterium]|nr:transcription termination factor Rho [Planctomycetota bacterium]